MIEYKGDINLLEEIKTIIEKSKKDVHLATIDVAAKKLGIGTRNLRKLTFEKDFPIIKIGVKKLIIMSQINDWLEKHRGEEFNL